MEISLTEGESVDQQLARGVGLDETAPTPTSMKQRFGHVDKSSGAERGSARRSR